VGLPPYKVVLLEVEEIIIVLKLLLEIGVHLNEVLDVSLFIFKNVFVFHFSIQDGCKGGFFVMEVVMGVVVVL